LPIGLLALLSVPAWSLGQGPEDAERQEKLRRLEEKVKALLHDVEALRKAPAARTPRRSRPIGKGPTAKGGPPSFVPTMRPPAGSGKRINFAISGKPWREVLKWLTEVTGKPVVTTTIPTGTCTIETPPARRYTMPEVIDLLNEALQSGSATQKYLLINRERSFTLVPADEKIDPTLLPRVRLEDLDRRGNTELVSVVVALRSAVAGDIAPEVKKLLGPFGEVVVLTRSNQLVLQDTVGNLRRIGKLLVALDQDDAVRPATFSYTCKYIRAFQAASVLRELLGADAKAPTAKGPTMPGRGPMPAPPRVSRLAIASDERTNTVLLTGPVNKVAEAREILQRIDVAVPGRAPILTGPPVLKMYSVPAGTAEALAKMLQDVYRSSSACRISAAGSNKLLVHASPHDQMAIARQILSLGDGEGPRRPEKKTSTTTSTTGKGGTSTTTSRTTTPPKRP
jgi:type II secretory pathway component GspD/PulD (secretin)